MQLTSIIVILALGGLASCYPVADKLTTSQEEEVQFLSNFESFRNDVDHHTGDGTYSFQYHVGNSEREEERTSSGEVSGKYAFVAPEGEEYEFKYNADEEGFRVESDALPEAPEDTDDVKEAKEEFFAAYEKALELAGSYEEDSDEDSDESSEESSEESDEDDDDSDEESSEESSEESDEDDSDEEEEEEEEESQYRSRGFFGIR